MALGPRIDFLYTNIGRGHPSYLDGILEAMVRRGGVSLVHGKSDVFEISHGLARAAWRLARWTYRRGSTPGVLGRLYSRLRSGTDYNRGGIIQSVMARDLRHRWDGTPAPLIVAHPSLVAMLSGCGELIYQHGELTVPDEALVSGASRVIVPTMQAANRFTAYGYSLEEIFVSGLCIEPGLVAQAEQCFEVRLPRLTGGAPLSGAFYSSGAEPADHVDDLLAAALSVVEGGGRAVIFAAADGRLAARAASVLAAGTGTGLAVVDQAGEVPVDLPAATLVLYRNRREERALTAKLYPGLDYFVAPPHERSNWALGLGLPLFMLGPDRGSFAPLNRTLLLEAEVAKPIESGSGSAFNQLLSRCRQSGDLETMARAGWQHYPIDGFARIAEWLQQTCGGRER